jgi:DNA polymerase-3 subunit delta'
MDFTNIVGHEDIIKHFKASIEMDRVGHAYIICGEEASGKKSLAKTFAKTLQCEQHAIDPCNECKSCLQVESGNHPDIIFVKHEKPKVITVDEIREQVVNNIQIKPYSGKYKIYIINDAQLMNVEAQNAILKTIEEPPQYAVIILLATTAEKFLPTIISRCMLLNLKPVKDEDIKNYLMTNFGIDSHKAETAVGYAAGNLGKAIKLVTNEEYQMLIRSVIRLETNIFDMGMEDIEETILDSDRFKVTINEYLDLMLVWYRDILVLKVTGNPDKIIFKENYSEIRNQSQFLSFNELEDKKKAIEAAKIRINANAKISDVMKLLIMTLKEK